MQVVILGAFIVTITLLAMPSMLAAPWWGVAPMAIAYVALAGRLTDRVARASLRAIERGQSPEAGMRRHGRMMTLVNAYLVVGQAAVMYFGYGAWLAEWLDQFPLVAKVAALAPFTAALTLMWTANYPYHLAVRRIVVRQQELLTGRPGKVWTLGQYLEHHFRHSFLFIAVPIALIILVSDTILLYMSPPLEQFWIGSYLVLAAYLGSIALVFLLAPVMVVRIWRTAPLPGGRLREDLETLCRQMGLRYRKLLVWLSDGMIANAGVMGLVAPVRYVLITDALLDNLDSEQIEAIFGHEAGHIVSHHLLYAAVFVGATVTLCNAAADFISAAAGLDAITYGQFLALGLLAAVWATLFGPLSRTFERQSDVIGAVVAGRRYGGDDRHVTPEGAAVFAKSLQSVAVLNAIPQQQHNWRHGSIAKRVNYILWLGTIGGTRDAIDRRVRHVKIGLWVALAFGIAATTLDWILLG